MIYPHQLFQEISDDWIFNRDFPKEIPAHEWIARIHTTLEKFFNAYGDKTRVFPDIPPQLFIKGDVYIDKNVSLPPYGYIEGPTYIGDNCILRPGVYIRGDVIVGNNCILGNSCEFKNSLLLDHVQVPHFNYVGDSILGSHSHLGAGCILSNLRFDRKIVNMKTVSGEKYPTGLKKLGAILGDYAKAGCNSVLQPGTCLFPHAKVYPCESFSGTRI